MNTNTANKVTVKLFVGVQITAPLRMHLNASTSWKNDSLAPEHPNTILTVTHYKDEDYLGIFLPGEAPSLHAIRTLLPSIKKQLAAYCPDFNTENINPSVFPQVFIN